ncbi:unnamed protein product [Medioppia subpectinata]|uniref:Uncharacterized protein n=1 Tax=Medioppia subpectinata TaxID=1979941 RepID=A0A7R9KPA9_9ACAR|nr:unnamed protein product [Medioppia subpectinata]CAG2107317.1 unnamed protein product [Medioppia subpectinata]
MAFTNYKTFRGVKICMEVLYVFTTIASIYLIVVRSIALNDHQKGDNTTAEILSVVGAVLGLLISIVGFRGIVRENKWMVAFLLVLTIGAGIADLVKLSDQFWFTFLSHVVCTVFTVIYLYLIIQKEKDTGRFNLEV